MFEQSGLGKIDFVEDEIEIVDCLVFLRKNKEKLWLWQEKKDERRRTHFGIINRIIKEKKIIMLFSGQPGIHFGFDSNRPVYVYSQEQKVAFQTKYKDIENEFINLEIPLKVGVLTKAQCEKLAVVEMENESAHWHKRLHERKHPEVGKFIRVEKVGSRGNIINSGSYDLYDMSQGGISFHIKDPSLFQTGERVKFIDIDGEPLGRKLYGTVMSVRWIKEECDNTILKVGVKFDDV